MTEPSNTQPVSVAKTPRGTRPRPGRQANHGDATGRRREALQQEHAEQIREREGELTTIANQRAQSINNDVVDYTDPSRPVIHGTDTPADPEQFEAEQLPDQTLISKPGSAYEVYRIEEPQPDPRSAREALRTDPDYLLEPVKFRANATVEGLTFGHGNEYNFEEGRQYVVPRALYLHLEDKELVWH